MRVERDPDGNWLLREVSVVVADTLQRVPGFLESEDSAVRARWFPRAYDGDDDEQHWRRYAGTELEHLFASNVELVRADLAAMEPDVPAKSKRRGAGAFVFRMSIPAKHKTAWLSALNGASHAVFLSSGLVPEDMEREPGSLGDPLRDVALLRVHVIGMVLSLLLEAEGTRYDPRLG